MNPLDNPSYLLPPLLAGLFSSVLFFVVARRARDSPAHRYFALFLFALALWSFLIFLMRSSPDTQRALMWERAVLPVMLASSPAFYFFALAYTRRVQSRAIHTLILGLYLAAIAFLAPTGLLVDHMELRSYGYAPIFSLPFYLLALGAYAWVVGGMVYLYRAWRASRVYEERNRLLYILIATIFPLVGTVLDIMPFTYPTSILGNLAFGAATTVAMRKYHLLDIGLVVRKGLTYIVMSTLIAVPYVGAILLATYVFPLSRSPLAYALLLVILALSLQPLWNQTQKVVDRLFFRRRWDYFRILEEFSQRTRSIGDLKRLASNLVGLVRLTVQTDGVSLLLPSAEGELAPIATSGKANLASLRLGPMNPLFLWLTREGKPLERYQLSLLPQLQALSDQDRRMLEVAGAELFIPLRVRERLTGLLALGPKLAESPYNQEEMRLLTTLASQMAILVEDARLFALEKARVAELEGLGQMKSDFFLAVAHHLKTPVTAIKASVEMLAELEDGNQPLAQKRLTAAMLRSSQSLEKAISDILDLLRIRAAAVGVEPEPTDVPELVREVVGLVQPILQHKEQTLVLDLPPSFPPARLDRRHFEQVLVNLLNNAQKFTPAGGNIGVALKQGDGFLEVEVQDTGPGIPEADQENIFEPFYQGRERATEPGGSGLGLAITRSLVELLGGRVWLRSKMGEGSTFGFSLPLHPPPSQPAAARTAPQPGER